MLRWFSKPKSPTLEKTLLIALTTANELLTTYEKQIGLLLSNQDYLLELVQRQNVQIKYSINLIQVLKNYLPPETLIKLLEDVENTYLTTIYGSSDKEFEKLIAPLKKEFESETKNDEKNPGTTSTPPNVDPE